MKGRFYFHSEQIWDDFIIYSLHPGEELPAPAMGGIADFQVNLNMKFNSGSLLSEEVWRS